MPTKSNNISGLEAPVSRPAVQKRKIRSPRQYLKIKLGVLGVASLLFLNGLYISFLPIWGLQSASLWLLVSGGALGLLFVSIFLKLGENHRQNEAALLSGFGPGTVITILRGLLLAALSGFLTSPPLDGWTAWIPGSLFLLNVAGDFMDGYLARASNHETLLGSWLDIQLDALGVLLGATLAVVLGQVPAWYLLVGLARYVFLLGLRLRRQFDLPIYELPHSFRRRSFAGFQMGFIGVILLPLFSPPGTYWAAALFMIPFLVGFSVDWLFACYGGRSPLEKVLQVYGPRLIAGLSLLLRGVIVFLLVVSLWSQLSATHFDPLSLSQENATLSLVPSWFLLLAEAVLLLLFFFGIAGRVASIALLVLLGYYQAVTTLATAHYVLAAAAILIFFLGTGPRSMWSPENRLIYRQAGRS